MLDEYLTRIGLGGRPSIAEIHRAHATTIPFENLDPRRGAPVSLVPEDLVDKLVTRRRGGYCFEHNLLLAAALTELGVSVEPMLARVRAGAPGVVRPRTHLVLRVDDGDRAWHADVGFGRGTLLEPIPFGAGDEHEQSGWRFRITAEGELLVMQALSDGEWVDQYAVIPEVVPLVDIEVGNWFTSTRPDSPFVTGLIAARYDPDGTLVMVSDWFGELALTRATPGGPHSQPLELAEVPALLSELFGLEGFELGDGGSLVARR